MSDVRSNKQRLPCGCVMWDEGDAFVFKPHDIKCPYYRYVLEEAERQEKPMMTRMIDE